MGQQNSLEYFKKTGFFDQKDEALKLLKDADEILTTEGVDYCLMFGTLLGLLRHNDFIPWDDDLDIIIFDIEGFEKRCRLLFETKGYLLFKDIRMLSPIPFLPFFKIRKQCGYRIYHKTGKDIPGVSWKFPWLGIWVHNLKGKAMTLPPEKIVYNKEDFFSLQRKSFHDFSVLIPNKFEKILNTYFKCNDWMEYCIPSALNHREFRPTGFPTVKRPLKEVLAFLESGK
ncbi:MAG: LicD family protein [Deltaproteobacteria bacterium]|nr:LicD family protein [Deltaproteobacteria bacterium]